MTSTSQLFVVILLLRGSVCDSLLLLYAHADATHPQSCTVLAIHRHMSPLTPSHMLVHGHLIHSAPHIKGKQILVSRRLY